jgi:uncharacterized membrane protein
MTQAHIRKAAWLSVGAAVVVLVVASVLTHEQSEFISIGGANEVEIPVTSIEPGQARFYVYHARNGGETRLIVARDDLGRVQAVLDACSRCYPYRRGYSASHGQLTCNYCDTHYKIGAMAHGMAGCEPIKIPFRMIGEAIRIETAELERQSKLF